MTLLRTALWAAVLSFAASAGGQGPVSAADGRTVVVTPDAPWRVAQGGPRNRDAEEDEEEERKKGRGRRDEKRDGPRRGESRGDGPPRVEKRKEARPPAKVIPDNEDPRPAARRRQPDRQDPPPRIEARPPVLPDILNKDAREKAREILRAKQKEAAEEKRDARDDRRDARDDRRDERRDAREGRRDDRRDARDDRRDDRREAREDWKQNRIGRPIRRLEDLKRTRRERVEEGGRRRIIEADKRVIVREKGRMIIRHDETERFRRRFKDARIERRDGGGRIARFVRPDGVHVISEYDAHDRLLRRYRRYRDGRIVIIIDNTRHYGRPGFVEGLVMGALLDLAPPVVRIPREKYIVEYEDASYEDVYEALSAPPIEELDRDYSLEEVRYNHVLRDRMRRIDLDSINFEFGSCEVDEDQYYKLERLADAINRLLRRNSEEVILIEGYTDAVGSEEDNMLLSDCRAEEVASILSEQFDVPAENLVTQGYGEQFLKIDTQEPERENRRVAARRITPFLSRRGS